MALNPLRSLKVELLESIFSFFFLLFTGLKRSKYVIKKYFNSSKLKEVYKPRQRLQALSAVDKINYLIPKYISTDHFFQIYHHVLSQIHLYH